MPQVLLEKPKGITSWLRLYRLYRTAFPRTERKPFGIIMKMYRQGRSDVWCITKDGKFTGLAATVNGKDLILLDYLAVSPDAREKGIGSIAMGELQRIYGQTGLFVEIESTFHPGENPEERKRRKDFYLHAGMEDLYTIARVFGVDMELLGSRCSMDFGKYQSFYREYYSAWAAEHIEEIPQV